MRNSLNTMSPFVLAASLWVSCHPDARPDQKFHPTPSVPLLPLPQPTVSEPVQVSMIVEALSREGLHILEPGEHLRSGERIAVRIEVDRSAYVYVLYVDTQGKLNKIFPDDGGPADRKIEAGRATRLPNPGDWFRLDRNPGNENVFVVAHTTPLSAESLHQRVQEDLRRNPLSPPPARKNRPKKYYWQPSKPPASNQVPYAPSAGRYVNEAEEVPPPAILETVSVRGLVLEQGLKPEIDSNGAAVLRFSFGHR